MFFMKWQSLSRWHTVSSIPMQSEQSGSHKCLCARFFFSFQAIPVDMANEDIDSLRHF